METYKLVVILKESDSSSRDLGTYLFEAPIKHLKTGKIQDVINTPIVTYPYGLERVNTGALSDGLRNYHNCITVSGRMVGEKCHVTILETPDILIYDKGMNRYPCPLTLNERQGIREQYLDQFIKKLLKQRGVQFINKTI